MPRFHTVKIKEVRRETPNAVSIEFDIPNELKSDFSFIAGQYVNIRTMLEEKELRRAYSLCSSPGSEKWRIAVKAVAHGKFSNYATTELATGDTLDISVPEGNFQLITNENHSNRYLGIAAGSGITPIMAMIKAVLIEEPKSSFVLIYGNKSVAETIFKNELDALVEANPNRFRVVYLYSREEKNNSLFGRIDPENLKYLFNNMDNEKFHHTFICGPNNMIKEVQEYLLDKKFNIESISTEMFSKPEEKAESEASSFQGEAKVYILLDDEETQFSMDTKESILTAALNEGIDAPYSCQGGICSSCLGRITEGSAVMDNNSILSDDEIEEGLILTCQAHPTSKIVRIDYDDV